jgi:hypothetical protein
VDVRYRWTISVVVPLLCLVCQSMLSNGAYEKLLISQKYNYVGVTHVLQKCTGLFVVAAGTVGTMERDKHIKSLSEFEFRIVQPVA